MAIAFVTSGVDDNVHAADNGFCGIPQPVGVEDGDLVIAIIAVAAYGATPAVIGDVVPPDDTWELVTVVKTPVITFNEVRLFVFKHTALCDPSNYVFETPMSDVAGVRSSMGSVVVYRGADAFQPVEVAVAKLTSTITTFEVPDVTASLGGEEMILAFLCGGNGTWADPDGFRQVAFTEDNDNTTASLAIKRRGLQDAGVITTAAPVFTPSVPIQLSVVLAILLTPSSGTLSLSEVYDRLFEAMPPGIDRLLDFTPSGDFYKYFRAAAVTLKTYAFDLVDTLRGEIVPSLSRYVLPTWESVFGLRKTKTALLGTIPQRRAQVQGAWRVAAGQGSSAPVVAGVETPLLGYAPGTTPEVVEASRSVLADLHTYVDTVNLSIPTLPSDFMVRPLYVYDGGPVAKMGARLRVTLTHTAVEAVSIALVSPEGTIHAIEMADFATGGVSGAEYWFFCPEFAGEQCEGQWKLEISDNDPLESGTIVEWRVFVEGCPGGLGDDVFDWGVYADPNLVGAITPPDYAAAQVAIDKIQQSHTLGRVLLGLEAAPNTSAAVPGRFLPK